MTLGPASVFLFISGGNNIHLAELKGSEIIQEAPAQCLAHGSAQYMGATAVISSG